MEEDNRILLEVRCGECNEPLPVEWENGSIGTIPNFYIEPHACDPAKLAGGFDFDAEDFEIFSESSVTLVHKGSEQRAKVDWKATRGENAREAWQTMYDRIGRGAKKAAVAE